MARAVRQKGWAEHKEHDQQNENSLQTRSRSFYLFDEKKN